MFGVVNRLDIFILIVVVVVVFDFNEQWVGTMLLYFESTFELD